MRQPPLSKVVGGLALAAGAVLSVYALSVRPWHIRWETTDEEVNRSLSGEDLVPSAKIDVTQAITIYAKAQEVWPWLIQMGQGRAGLYSYDWLRSKYCFAVKWLL